jgi:hypothetical protein
MKHAFKTKKDPAKNQVYLKLRKKDSSTNRLYIKYLSVG